MADRPELSEEVQEILKKLSENDKQTKLERYRRLNKSVREGQILFVGSSLMEQFPVNELLMDLELPLTIYNRGVGGFTTQELMDALDVCVFDLKPRHIFINIGTNDLNGPDYELSGLIDRYEAILQAIREKLPEASLTLLAYYPVNEPVGLSQEYMAEIFKHRTNARVREANEAVRLLAQRMGAAFVDVNAPITDENGNMKEEYTIEGMHMYADGYLQVLKALLPVLQKLD